MNSPDNKSRGIEEGIAPTVDRRLFDADGNVREEIAAEREEDAPEEELTLELLASRISTLETQTMNAMGQVDATFTQFGQEFGALTQQIRATISDMHVRIGVLEEINCNPDLADDRVSIQNNTFTFDRFRTIAEDIVIPDMKVKAEAVQQQMKERYDRMHAAIQEGLTPEEALQRVNAEDEKKANSSKIEIVSS